MRKEFLGYFFLTSSSIFYALFGLLSRYTGKFPPFSQGWVKHTIILSLLLLLFISKTITWKKIKKEDIKLFLLWILPASFQPILTFIAYNHLPLGLTYFLLYATIILGGLISGKIFFSEKFDKSKFISFFLILLGLLFIYQSDVTLIQNIYVFFAIFSGLVIGFWNTLSKKVSKKYSEFQMMFLDGFSTLCISMIGAVILKESLPPLSDSSSWFWIFIFALSNIAASFFLIRGFKFVEAQVGSLILPLEVVFASLFGYIFFGEILKTSVYVGGILIAVSSILPNIFILYNNNKRKV